MGATLVHDLEEIVHAGSDNFFLLMPNSGNFYSVSGSMVNRWINWGSNCVQGMSRGFELGPVEGVKATKTLL